MTPSMAAKKLKQATAVILYLAVMVMLVMPFILSLPFMTEESYEESYDE